MRHILPVLMLLAAEAAAQTTINGSRSILGEWNAGAASRTVPMRTGPAASLGAVCSGGELYFATDAPASRRIYECRGGAWAPAGYYSQAAAPATCSVGEVWFDIDEAPGRNWYGCTAPNTWTAMGGSGGWRTVFSANYPNGMGANAIAQIHPGNGWASSVERNVAIKLSQNGTIENLRVYVDGLAGTGAAATCTVYKGTGASYSATAVTATTSGTGSQDIFSTGTAPVAAGENIYLRCTANASVTGSFYIRNWTLEYRQ